MLDLLRQDEAIAEIAASWVEAHSVELACVAASIAALSLLLARRNRMSSHDEEVRAHAAAGRHREAGDLQLRRGRLDMAYTLYVRGEVWERASFVAERLGHLEDAADHAKNAGDWKRAAGLFERSGAHRLGVKAWTAAGRPDEAARVLEDDPDATPTERARAWEDAYNHLRADDTLTPRVRDERIERVLILAHKAALRAGDDVGARRFEMLRAGETPPAAPHPTRELSAVPEHCRTPAGAAATPATDDSRYELGRKLGEGGMGCVYEATDQVLGRKVAIKLLPEQITARGSARDLFAREAKAAAALTHPNIVVVYDFGVLGGRPFLSMELVDGGSVADRLDEHPSGLPFAEVISIARDLLAGLQFAHRQRIVHRDVKPANILLSADGTAKLTDFGIAKIIDTQRDITTLVAGTPPYMAPEQLAGKGICTRTDLFAVGVTLYQLVTGRLPFEGVERNEPPAPPSVYRADTPSVLESVILACLKKDKRDRPSGCAAVLEVLDRINAPAPAPTSHAPLPFRPRKRPELVYSTRGTAERIGA